MLERRRLCKLALGAVVLLTISGFLYQLGYFCPSGKCALKSGAPTPKYKPDFTDSDSRKHDQYVLNLRHTQTTPERGENPLNRLYDFDIDGEDVLVFLHIQKTGGTVFGRHLVRNLDIEVPCKCYKGVKRCDCQSRKRHIWLFSRFSTGWRCGLHADWTELQACVPEAMDHLENSHRHRRYRYLYLTILRPPLQRYLSEWLHVQRGATWLEAKLKCNGRSASLEEVPFCFTGEDWSGVSLEDFLACPHNLANNRQTRMLANLSLVQCYNFSALPPDQRDAIMLQSAKDNLKDMAFFGLTAYQTFTQYMFEKTFSLEFKEDFVDRNLTHAQKQNISSEQEQRILSLNHLDVQLYEYAEELFLERLHAMRQLQSAGSGEKPSVQQTEDLTTNHKQHTTHLHTFH